MIKICRIVYLITELNVGGAENSLYQLVTHLNPKKFSPIVCSLSGEGKIGEKLKAKGIEVVCLGAKNKCDIAIFFKLIKFLRAQKPHILHTYLFHANFIGRIAGRVAGVPIVISSVRTMEKQKWHHVYLDMFTCWMVDKEICVSKDVEKFTGKYARVPAPKLITIYNGIDFSGLHPTKNAEDKKEELSIRRFSPIIGTVGHLTVAKGVDYLLKAFKLVLADFPNACLLIVGSGEQEKKLKILAEDLNILTSVKFLGFREDNIDIINTMDVFVLPSLWEGMPNVILEAYALGKPVVSTRVGGSAEIIKNGKTGFLVPTRDEKSLANSIRLLLKNTNMRQEFGNRGKEFISKNFSLDRMVKDTEKLYEELIRKQFKTYN
jgi:glycosyltransferase involved in cell wall biosynthesis